MKLKTLKDISEVYDRTKKLKTVEDLRIIPKYDNPKDNMFVCKQELKDLAIKWVKAKGITISRHDFEMFHNITEDDLQ